VKNEILHQSFKNIHFKIKQKMKKLKNASSGIIILTAATLSFLSCKKSKDDTAPAADIFPTPIQSMITQSMVDSLRAAGANIYSGTTPAIVNGTYFMHPDSCTYDNSPGNFAGTLFVDYKFRFSAQDNSTFNITIEQKNMSNGTLSPTPASSYISGDGNNFSIFILRTVSPMGVPVQQFNVLSGSLTAAGIQNFKNVLYIRSKGSDPGNTLPPAGTIRVFVNGAPGLAANSSTF
jgi:hypothetical protein